jgi:hypothetical protein
MTVERNIKFVWRVDPPPTGQFRSFERRAWPSAEVNGNPALRIECEANDGYTPARARGEEPHGLLSVRVADYRNGEQFRWRTLKQDFSTLSEAKAAGEAFLRKYPDFLAIQAKGDAE